MISMLIPWKTFRLWTLKQDNYSALTGQAELRSGGWGGVGDSGARDRAEVGGGGGSDESSFESKQLITACLISKMRTWI